VNQHVAIPVVRTAHAPEMGRIYVACVVLAGDAESIALPDVDTAGSTVTVRWPDAATVELDLPTPPPRA
jgi:hypothetical protein